MRKQSEKEYIYIYLSIYLSIYLYLSIYQTDSLCCTPETHTNCKSTILQYKVKILNTKVPSLKV